MNLSDRQSTDNFRNFRVAARQHSQLQLAGGFDGEAGVLLSESGRLWLAAVVDAEQHERRRAPHGQGWFFRFRSHDDVLLESKRDPVRGPWVSRVTAQASRRLY